MQTPIRAERAGDGGQGAGGAAAHGQQPDLPTAVPVAEEGDLRAVRADRGQDIVGVVVGHA